MYFPANFIVGGLRYFEYCWRQGGGKTPPPSQLDTREVHTYGMLEVLYEEGCELINFVFVFVYFVAVLSVQSPHMY
jgi:hypothetical protein